MFVEGMKEIRDLWGIEESRFLELSVVRNQKRKNGRGGDEMLYGD